jgi:hypothetical protein
MLENLDFKISYDLDRVRVSLSADLQYEEARQLARETPKQEPGQMAGHRLVVSLGEYLGALLSRHISLLDQIQSSPLMAAQNETSKHTQNLQA